MHDHLLSSSRLLLFSSPSSSARRKRGSSTFNVITICSSSSSSNKKTKRQRVRHSNGERGGKYSDDSNSIKWPVLRGANANANADANSEIDPLVESSSLNLFSRQTSTTTTCDEEEEENGEKSSKDDEKLNDGNERILWQVPWSISHVVVIMMMWLVSFLWVGQSFVPWATFHMGFDADALTSRGVAVYSLFADIAACVIGIFCVWFGTRKFKSDLKGTNWFRFKFGSVQELKRCSKETLFFIATFPLVNVVAEFNSKLCDFFANGGSNNFISVRSILDFISNSGGAINGFGRSGGLTTPVAINPPSNFERIAMSGDGVSVLFYAILVSVVAPIWEEIIFRGFLLPSLTKKWRISTSICLSSCIFALAHFSLERFLPLSALSIALSILYVRTRNILAPIVLHALWNAAAVLEATDTFEVLLEWLLEAFGMLIDA